MDFEKIKEKLNQRQPLFVGEDTAFRSSVIIPFVQIEEEWHILFEVRSFKMRSQPGDISFPGGKIDQTDSSPLEAAIRETSEELGINRDDIKVISSLSPFIASPAFVVYPFVAVIDCHDFQTLNKEEVEEVFTVPLSWLLQYEPYCHKVAVELKPSPDFPFHKIMKGKKYDWRARSVDEWFFDYNGYTIWGLTARILKHFTEGLK
ncbi:CoA pyrophosphatase [Bacillus sp. BGMRC 2118]|nr:CoA pyrophosphatase [Bacillus sp. BGMRC 2118]